jgi:5-methylcytosine-specific restriction endonuclease McrA
MMTTEGVNKNRRRKKSRTGAPQRLRFKLLIRSLESDGCLKCYICERTFTDPEYIGIDHITPASAGGEDAIENLAISCIPCNAAKTTLSIEQVQTLKEWKVWDELRTKYIDERYEHHQSALSKKNAAIKIASIRERLNKL